MVRPHTVRGDPRGNRNITAEGYERGLGFLPGAAIDIHVAQRNRLPDLVSLIRARPQLLGIGLDEGTALEIRGATAVVLGRGTANIVTVDAAGAAPTVTARSAGDRYDLAKRAPLR